VLLVNAGQLIIRIYRSFYGDYWKRIINKSDDLMKLLASGEGKCRAVNYKIILRIAVKKH
jgi:hypothetical protein